MPVHTARIYDHPPPEMGTRILVMRYHPRGIPREAYEEWYRELGPTPELLRAWRSGRLSWEAFAEQYRTQIRQDPEASRILKTLVRRSQQETLVLLCACRDAACCHRTLLKALMEQASPE